MWLVPKSPGAMQASVKVVLVARQVFRGIPRQNSGTSDRLQNVLRFGFDQLLGPTSSAIGFEDERNQKLS